MAADRLAQALEDAATSLETISKNAGHPYDTDGYENLLEHHHLVRVYAASRASAAREVLVAYRAQSPAEGDVENGSVFAEAAALFMKVDALLKPHGWPAQKMLRDYVEVVKRALREASATQPQPKMCGYCYGTGKAGAAEDDLSEFVPCPKGCTGQSPAPDLCPSSGLWCAGFCKGAQAPAVADGKEQRLISQIREVCAATLKAGPGVAVPIPDNVRAELLRFMRGEPNLIEKLPFCDVQALAESPEVVELAESNPPVQGSEQ